MVLVLRLSFLFGKIRQKEGKREFLAKSIGIIVTILFM